MPAERYRRLGHARPWPQRAQKSSRARRAAVIGGLVAVAVGALLWGWRIKGVEATGATIVPNAAVRDAVLAGLQGNQWLVFPRTSMLLMRTGRLEREIRDYFAFAEVSARRHVDGRLLVSVTEQPGIARVRFEEGAAALLAESGQIVAPLPESLNEAAALFDIQWFGPLVPMGASLASKEALDLLRGFWAELSQAGGVFRPQSISNRIGQSTSFDIRTAGGAIVTVNSGEAADRQITKFRAVLRNYSTPESRAKLHIIDLRYGDRVYVQ